MSVVDSLRNAVNPLCIVYGDLVKDKCKVILDVATCSSVSVDLDHSSSPIDRHSTRCDFLHAAEYDDRSYVVVLELTSNIEKSLSTVSQQLSAGAQWAQSVVPRDLAVRFIPALIAKNLRKKTKILLKKADRNKVVYHGKRERIVWFRNGVSMSAIFNKTFK